MENLPSAKELKKLADACRKAGIKSFKGYGIEFTLSDAVPAPRAYRKAAPKKPVQASDKIETDEPSEEELLFWSSAQGIPVQGEQ